MPSNQKTRKQRNVCYTGIYANKQGFYTQQGFMKTMKRHFGKKCSHYVRSRSCSPCIRSRKIHRAYAKQMISAVKKGEKYVLSPEHLQQLVKIDKKCRKCETTKNKPCDSADYRAYSGAILCDAPLNESVINRA